MRRLYRADHVGSLLRPAEILKRRTMEDGGDDLRALEDRHILRILAKQKDFGFQIFSDGELRRRGFMSGFYDAVDGFASDGHVARRWKGERAAASGATAVESPAGLVVAPLRQKKRLAQHEAEFLVKHSPGDAKMTLPSATQFPAILYRKGVSERAYPTHSHLLMDVIPMIRSEIRMLASDGIRYIQIDAPRYSYYLDPRWREYIRDTMGVTPEEALDEAICADNATLDGLQRTGLTVGIHLCRGNNRSQWYAEGGYDPIAEKLFNELNVDVFLLEYDSARAGTFEPLRFVPPDKGVVLGLISSKYAELEDQDELCRRIEEASRYVPIANLALSPQCGFASTFEGNLLSEDDQWRKLELVTRTAQAVWPDA